MRPLRWLLLGFGLLMLLAGLLWIGQGTGVFPYPRQSVMIDQHPWAWRGLVLALAGIGCIIASRRVAPRR